jgi:putative tryptophan/tyrosine transport system substrate-binding protein
MKRTFIGFTLSAMLFALSYSASAQQANKVPRIGFLGNSTEALEANLVGPFRQGLRELGYVEGQTISIDYRWGRG